MDANQLSALELFAQLSPEERERVAHWADEIEVDTGHHLIRRDGFGYEFFVILDGNAEVMDGDVHLADLKAGDFFGEIALIEQPRRSASVRATSPMRLMVMGRPEFASMTSHMPLVAERIHARIAERMDNSKLK
ncbi:MAG: family transcriptional regulator, cyclic receptor protein [Gaiellales bacterium]|jgi:CRP-like cAMP-binding protein|nr:family transcriptional regulator, cyclic receptor protein [Gaiellales bacterium]MDX6545879.1 family transcriptional regulator, cyclic receptor protein [Gaiellales bacterium]MDX6550586.1 family transcriptional regulator, cyclic receptor protein [Gaiellales bacterium]